MHSMRSFTNRNYNNSRDLPQDSYSLMMLADAKWDFWAFGILVWFFQMGIILLVITSQFKDWMESTERTTYFNIEYCVKSEIYFAQFLSIILAVISQTEIWEPVYFVCQVHNENWKQILLFDKVPRKKCVDENNDGDDQKQQGDHFLEDEEGRDLVDDDDDDDEVRRFSPLFNMFIPNFLQFLQGCLVLCCIFIFIIQSTNVLDVLMNFAAFMFISNVDDVIFIAVRNGLFTDEMRAAANYIANAELKGDDTGDSSTGGRLHITRSIQRTLTFFILAPGITLWAIIVTNQVNGSYFNHDYPLCEAYPLEIGDGKCDHNYNDAKCNWDGGDCLNIGEGVCDDYLRNVHNISTSDSYDEDSEKFDFLYRDWDEIGNGVCNYSLPYYSKECQFDGGDCWFYHLDQEYCNTYMDTNMNMSGSYGAACDVLSGSHSQRGKDRKVRIALGIFVSLLLSYITIFVLIAFLAYKRKDDIEQGAVTSFLWFERSKKIDEKLNVEKQ